MTRWRRGSDLSESLKREAKAAYLYRNTVENRAQRKDLFTNGAMKSCTAEPETDAQWLRRYAFAVTKDGRRFDSRVRHCEIADLLPNDVLI